MCVELCSSVRGAAVSVKNTDRGFNLMRPMARALRSIEFGKPLAHHAHAYILEFLRNHSSMMTMTMMSFVVNLAVRRKRFRLMYEFMSSSCSKTIISSYFREFRNFRIADGRNLQISGNLSHVLLDLLRDRKHPNVRFDTCQMGT
jgi:hypothetical protein